MTNPQDSKQREGNLSGRQLAQFVLDRIEQRASYINLALPEVFKEYPNADRRERAFCTELVYGTLRHLLKLDFILGRLLSRPLSSLKIPVKNVLRLALYQLIYLTEIPERAICYSAVEQVKKSRFEGLAPLVNGVLRAYLRNQNNLKLPDPLVDPVEYMVVQYSHPRWLVERWLKRFGPDLTERILKTDNEQPPLTVRINQHLAPISTILTELSEAGVEFTPGLFVNEAVNIEHLPEIIEELAAFMDGRVSIQDESSMLVAHLLDPVPGELIIDLCAAPGGKSTHLAELMGDRGKIISVDDHQHKVHLISEAAARLHLDCIQPFFGDARNFEIPGESLADAVLVDAPCTGTGVLRRRVDARYRRQPEDIDKLVEIQRAILNRAAELVRPGGRLVYSTCTLEPEEDQEQIKWFLETHPQFELSEFRARLPELLQPYLEDPSSQNWLTILPISNGGDGFFMCRLNRVRD